MDQNSSINAAELLAWYHDAGVDVCLQDEPIDRFAEAAQQALQKPASKTPAPNHSGQSAPPSQYQKPSSATAAPIPTPAVTVPDGAAVENAKELAQSCKSLEDLKRAVEGFEGCNLKFSAHSTVFSDGNPQSKLMVVGEAPGRDEDIQGLPFVGRSGALLNQMLKAIGLERTDVYISNVLPWRPPGNRAPTPMETEICRPFIERHIALVEPEILVLVGGSAAKTLMKTTKGILSLRGRWTELEIDGKSFPAIPTLHPAYLLRQPLQKRHAWRDLLAVSAKLQEFTGKQ